MKTPHLNKVLSKMFLAVKAKEKPLDFVKTPEWYTKYTWTIKEQTKFGSWLANYLFNHPQAQREMYTSVSKSKKLCSERAAMFILSYGWKIDDKVEKNGKNNLKNCQRC